MGSNLAKAAMYNSGLGMTLGGQRASKGELMDNARRIMAELPVGSFARRFYREIGDNAESMMQRFSSSHFD